MRQIKFRALYEGVWYYQTLEEMLTITLAAFRMGEHKTQLMGQDMNGKEMYEGDIVTMISYNYQHLNNEKWEVIYSEEDMRFKFKKLTNTSNGRTAYEDTMGWHSFQVIGNIYEHPHLLEQTKQPTP